jgi:N6-adenosine-specific RNA methylase IME4
MNEAPVIDAELAALIPPLSPEEREQLERNLKGDGCRDPLVTWDGILLDGHNRYEICKRLGIGYRSIAMSFPDRGAAKAWVAQNQLGRRNLSPYSRAELALSLEPIIAAKAKANLRTSTGGSSPRPCQISDKVDTKRAMANVAGVSHDTIQKAKVIAAKASESVKAKLRAGETTINKEHRTIKKAERQAVQVAAVKAAKLPDGKFHVIVADPPWCYEKRAMDISHRGATPYPTMLVPEIESMGIDGRHVSDLAYDDCILWLWTTNAFMEEAHGVARAWGFTVKTILTWGKDRMGVGDWLRGQTEHCLMCVKGNPVVTLTNQTTLLHGPMREHSRKPDEFYALVESLCPGRKCELFSRQEREGWESFGAETGKFEMAA